MRIKKLGDYIAITKGKKHQISEEPSNKSIRFIQIDDLRNNNNIKLTDDSKGVSVVPDDLIIAWDGANAGTIGFGIEGFIGSTLARLRKKDKLSFDTIFLAKFLQSKFSYLRKTATGATIPHISRKALDSIILPNLEYEDQIRIAKILSRAEALIAQRKESIQLLDELLKSTFLDMFGQINNNDYSINSLNSVSFKINDGEHGSVKKVEEGVLYLMARNITRNNQIDLSETSYVSQEDHDKMYKRCNPEAGDVLLVCVGATIGKAVIVPNNMDEFSIARSVALIKPDIKKILPQYLIWFFNSELGKRQIKKYSNEAAQAGLYIGNLKKIEVPLPPIDLQAQFAQIVEKVESIKTKYQESLQELENLYASLSQKAFKGEIDLARKEV